MPEAHTIAESNQNAANYWKFCSIMLGIGLVFSLMGHAGPSTASASFEVPPGWRLIEDDSQSSGTLRIDGFGQINNRPAFVLIDENGQGVGLLPMKNESPE